MNLDTVYRMLRVKAEPSHCRGERRAAKRRTKREDESATRIARAMAVAMPHLLARGKVLDDRRAAMAQQLRAWRMGGKP